MSNLSNGTYSYSYATYAKAGYFRSTGSGSASYPAHSFNSNYDSGMYYDSGVAFSYGGSLKLKLRNTEIQASDDIRPALDDSWWLGSASLSWKRLYAVNATILSSDAALKENLTPISNGLAFISSLSPMTYIAPD